MPETITKTYELISVKGVKGWIRDSWARRAIVALQQAIAAITVPTASTANPQMDGTAAPGSSTDYARADHVHPHDTSKADAATTYTKTEVDALIPTAGLLVPYGYCTTAAATVAKTVTVSPAVTSLETGLTIAVKFQYANTGSNPTLNVNSLGAKAIKRYGTTAAGTSAAANWNANSVVMLTYDGTYWMLVDWNNTTYSGMSDAEYQAGTGTSNRLITPARLKAAIELHAPVQSVNGSTGAVTVNVPTKTSDLTNDSGFITSAPVASVNGQTGAVTLDATDVGALPDTTPIPTVPTNVSAFTNDSGYITASAVPSASTSNPAMDGTASPGSSTAWARGDHVHPSDTSKQDALTSAQLEAVNSGITSDDLAVNDASVLCTATLIVPTLSSPYTQSITFGGCFYYKIGHRVHIHIGVNGLTSGSQADLWYMPVGYRPHTYVGQCGTASAFTAECRVRVAPDGKVYVNANATGACVDLEYDAFQ